MNTSFIYLPFISSVGQSPKPHGISVVPRISPKIKPNRIEINMPKPNAANPTF